MDDVASNPTAHITNQRVQKKNPKYKLENHTWSFEELNDYINDHVRMLVNDLQIGPLLFSHVHVCVLTTYTYTRG